MWLATTQTNKQTRNETSRGVSQQVRLGTILRVGKQENHGKPKVTVNGDLIPNQFQRPKSIDQRLTVKYRSRLYQRLKTNHKTMLRRESYLTFPDQKDANARFYTRVGTPKYLITKPIENQVNIVTTLVTRIKAWKSRNQWKVLF